MRIVLAALLSLIPLLTRADATSEELLDRMRQTISSYASYEVRFTASGGLFSDIAGRCIVSGKKYYLDLQYD
jgi:hypothetical protein